MSVRVQPDVDLILQRLKEGRLDSFINSFEWRKFECKVSPYQLDNTDQKFELAKDVAAMANVDGGVILIGAKTAKAETGRSEIVTEISVFPDDLVNLSQMTDILSEWLYPAVRDLHIAWYPSSHDKTKGVVAILVLKASDELRPILVKRALKDTGKIRGNVFGVFERWQEETTFFDAEQLHAIIRSGLNSQIYLQRFDALQTSIDSLAAKSPLESISAVASAIPPQNATEHVPRKVAIGTTWAMIQSSYVEDVGLSSLPTYVLRGIPVAPLSIPGMFASQQSPIRALVQDPPKLRYGGFGVDGGGPAQIDRGHSWRSIHTGAHRLLEVKTGGEVLFVAPADETFLCWGKHHTAEAKRLNPVVLIESVYLFAELLRQLQALTDPKNVGYWLTVSFERFKETGQTVVLSPGLFHAYGIGLDLHDAPEDKHKFQESWVQGEIIPTEFAYNLVAQIYVWFGFTLDKIPLVRDFSEKKMIDVEAIKNLRG